MKAPFRWWFLPSWLGLDAPCVVTTWTWAISWSAGLPLRLRPALAMFLVVWSIYLADRLIDVARCRNWEQATGRLRFGRQFRPLFLVCLGFCFAGLVVLAWIGLPEEVVWRAVLVAGGVTMHFLLFIVPLGLREKLPGKEFDVGLFFALGAFACLGATATALPLFAAVALAVAYNCLVIASRDADSDRANDPGAASRWWKTMRRDLVWVGAALTAVSALWAILAEEKAFCLAVTAAFAALTVLQFYDQALSGDAVRSLADFALFTPLPVLGAFGGLHPLLDSAHQGRAIQSHSQASILREIEGLAADPKSSGMISDIGGVYKRNCSSPALRSSAPNIYPAAFAPLLPMASVAMRSTRLSRRAFGRMDLGDRCSLPKRQFIVRSSLCSIGRLSLMSLA